MKLLLIIKISGSSKPLNNRADIVLNNSSFLLNVTTKAESLRLNLDIKTIKINDQPQKSRIK